MPVRLITASDFDAFIRENPFAAIHLDADWDGLLRAPTRVKMLEADTLYGDQVNFGEVDIDVAANFDVVRSIPVRNIPAVAYYREGQLVAALIMALQNVRARVERMMRGEPIGYKDGMSQPWRG